jgi:hypothetical protein
MSQKKLIARVVRVNAIAACQVAGQFMEEVVDVKDKFF